MSGQFLAKVPKGWILLACLGLLALNLRGPFVAVSPVVDLMQSDLGFTPVMRGLLTSIPLLCFARPASRASLPTRACAAAGPDEERTLEFHHGASYWTVRGLTIAGGVLISCQHPDVSNGWLAGLARSHNWHDQRKLPCPAVTHPSPAALDLPSLYARSPASPVTVCLSMPASGPASVVSIRRRWTTPSPRRQRVSARTIGPASRPRPWAHRSPVHQRRSGVRGRAAGGGRV